jgi:hypothetical protein
MAKDDLAKEKDLQIGQNLKEIINFLRILWYTK